MDATRHIEVFNEAVISRDWDEFVNRVDDDATIEFVGPPVGPFIGRDAIAASYNSTPPVDTIEMHGEPQQDGSELVVPYRWVTTGESGTMRFTENNGLITRLIVTFD